MAAEVALKSLDIKSFIAWSQYLHWADLQFRAFLAIGEDGREADRIGALAHWLAAEHVVLEGWTELEIGDPIVSLLVERYPENVEVLRRCRNAVYHFQKVVLDPRICKVLADQNEELKWATAMHYEYHRFFVQYPYMHAGPWEERELLAKEIEDTLGWYPKRSPQSKVMDLYRKCIRLHGDLESDDSDLAKRIVREIDGIRERLLLIDCEPFTKALSRM